MKKYLAICAVMLLGASLALAACTPTQNDGPEQGETPEESPGGEIKQELTPVIPGDYHAPTAAELGYALSLLEENGEYIDGQPVGIEVDGLAVEARLDLAMQSAEDKLTMEGAGSYDLYIENARTGAAVGAGDVRLDAAYTAGEEQESVAVSGSIYHDDAFLYCDVTENGEVHRGKVSYELLPFLLEEISSDMPFEGGVLPLRGMRQANGAQTLIAPLPEAQPLIAPSEEAQAAEKLLETLAAAGLSLEMDDSAGLKLRIYANDDYFQMLGDAVTEELPGAEVTFPTKTAEVYYHINEACELEQLSADIDLDYTVSYAGEEVTVSAGMQLVAKNSDARVTLPDDLSDREKYPEYIPSVPSADGVITTFYYTSAPVTETVYDAATDTVTVAAGDTFVVRDAATGAELDRTQLDSAIACADAYDGMLCLGLGDAEQIYVFDLTAMQGRLLTVNTSVDDLVVMEGGIVYCERAIFSEVYRCDFDGENRSATCPNTFQYPYLAANRDDNIVYAAETGNGFTKLFYIYLDTQSALSTFDFTSHMNNMSAAWYDGVYVHFDGATYDPSSGEKISETPLAEQYPASEAPAATLYISDKYSFVIDQTGGLLIFDRQANQFIYRSDVVPGAVFERDDGTFFLTGILYGYAAIIDPAQI